MKCLRIDTKNNGWINRFVLRKDKDEFVLKVIQYQLKLNYKKRNEEIREIHIFGNDSVQKLKRFLNENVK